MTSTSHLAGQLSAAPHVHDAVTADREWADLLAVSERAPELAALRRHLQEPQVRDLVRGIFGTSPFLTSIMQRAPARLAACLQAEPFARFESVRRDMSSGVAAARTVADAMRALRTFKAEVALLTALADLGGVWPVMTVTRVLSEAADAAVQASVRFLFGQAAARGDWILADLADLAQPERTSGYMVIAMGKHGAFELNYSSDIDLIVFYDPDKSRLKPSLELQPFMVRITRDLVRMLQERTGDGYVFRTDLRLRPDAGATAVAMSTNAALHYYEAFGQNWERAALIKARAIAGDIDAGERLLGDLAPFVWRKYLDYAAIADIHAMKRQINAFKGFGTIGVAGHNIKVGRGGIREIEFFAQTQQLIAGGRQKGLRVRATLEALDRLVERDWIAAGVAAELGEAYLFLRRIEHCLQMIGDEQTQTLPDDEAGLARVAHIAGFADVAAFSAALVTQLTVVQRHYVRLFESSPALSSSGSNMVFAGEADDPGTVTALRALGYSEPTSVIATVRGWHHGRYPAVRTPRARELLTEVQPLLIDALSKTTDPDLAFAGFDRFLSRLPSGVQLFSLLLKNPSLLDLIAAIAGTAPRLADVLGRRRRVIDAVLDPGFFGTIATPQSLRDRIDNELKDIEDQQAFLDQARVTGSEQSFLIGVRVLTGTIGAEQAGPAYALLADHMIRAMAARVMADMELAHGHVPGGEAAVIAMGKLGGREMTAASDLDLIVIYDFDPAATQSDGARPLPPVQYYSRLTQRLISALAAQTAEGALYEVDMRLRPSGQKGPVATQLASFISYQATEAWTWEHMALTRARVVTGSAALTAMVGAAIADTLMRPRDRSRIAADVREMRQRVEADKGTTDIWELKQVRGGLVDLEFIVQHLQLVHGHERPGVLDQNTAASIRKLASAGILSAPHADTLGAAAVLYGNLTQILRLCLTEAFIPAKAPDGLKRLLSGAANLPDFSTLSRHLSETQTAVLALFDELVV
jgi:[glutamine synthetase] adenylyltransferase / [glutamine synthetase]-adenylyl-L-tyrosine phosphorylase